MQLKIKNITSDFSFLEVRNQFEVETARGLFYQSYDGIVAHIDNNHKLTLSPRWNISNTTRKYLYMFLRKHGFRYYNDKKSVVEAISNKEIKVSAINY